MKDSVFVKVRAEDELPVFPHGQYKAAFTTDRGFVYYCKYEGWYENVEWWLKEVKLPSEDELRKKSLGKFSEKEAADEEIGDYIEDDAKTFMAGANYILSKLK